MKSWVPFLRLFLILVFFKTAHWISDVYPEPSLLILVAELTGFVLVTAVWLYLGRFEPNITVPCPHCGHGNIKERRICKRCRENVPPVKPVPPEESPPLIQHWVEVEIEEAAGRAR